MLPKKLFFPVGGGDELDERICGALLVTQYLKTHLEILLSQARLHHTIPQGIAVQKEVMKQIEEIHMEQLTKELDTHRNLVSKYCDEKGVKFSETPISDTPTAYLSMGVGIRSELVAQQSKFCDMVIAAAPPKGVVTATFEASILESGKPVMVIPRKMTEFKLDNIIVGWNNSPQASRAVSEAIPFMKNAKKVHIVSSKAYTTETLSRITDLRNYLALHEIETTFELIKTTFIPGEALLHHAQDGGFDLIVAGAYAQKGLREMMLGGTAMYLLKHTTMPALMAH